LQKLFLLKEPHCYIHETAQQGVQVRVPVPALAIIWQWSLGRLHLLVSNTA